MLILIAGILVGVGAVVAWRGVENARNVRTPVYRIAVDGLPEEVQGMAVVHWTDLHVDPREIGTPVTSERTRKICGQVAASLAEQEVGAEQVLHVFTGDFVNDRTTPGQLAPVLAELAAMPGKKVFVLGNHDVNHLRTDEIVAMLLRHGFLELGADPIIFGELQLQGTADIVTQPELVTGEVLRELEKPPVQPVRVLATHNLDALPESTLEQLKNTLVLAGHTHGGQWGIIPRRWREWMMRVIGDYEYRSQIETGVAQINKNTTASVSNGVGTHSLPMRYGAQPEVPIWIFEALVEEPEHRTAQKFSKKIQEVFRWE